MSEKVSRKNVQEIPPGQTPQEKVKILRRFPQEKNPRKKFLGKNVRKSLKGNCPGRSSWTKMFEKQINETNSRDSPRKKNNRKKFVGKNV